MNSNPYIPPTPVMPDWAMHINAAVTVCDKEGIILYMNQKARETFSKYGSLIGKSLLDCHGGASKQKIFDMLAHGHSNAYTISKNGQRKMIYQTPWRENGLIAGLVEISMVIPGEMPHYQR